MQAQQPPYLITAQELVARLTTVSRQKGLPLADLPLNASISGWNIALTQDNFHVSDTGSLIILLPPPRQRVKHYNVCVFGQRMSVVQATEYDDLRRQLCATEQQVQQLEALRNPTAHSCLPYT